MAKKNTKPRAAAASAIRDRVKELRRIPARDLVPNKANWRRHSAKQKSALSGLLVEIGYAGALIAWERPDGMLELIDGHLRADTTPDAIVPVLVLDVTEAEAKKLLATMDPLAAMADMDGRALESLLSDIQTSDQSLLEMYAKLSDAAVSAQLREMAAEPTPELPEPVALGPGEVAASSDGPTEVETAGVHAPHLQFTVPLTPAEEADVREAIKVAKKRFGVAQSGAALALAIKEWLDGLQEEIS